MSKLPCEVVKDLFPSYIDELTGEVTNNLIEEHTNECEECRQALESMKSPEAEPEKQSQKKEIDYLKKTRKKYRKRIIAAILVVLAVVLGGLGVKHYIIGNTISYEYLTCVPEVNGQELSVVCMVADANMRISKIQFEEKDGVINISCKGVQRELVDVVGVKGSYVAEQKIKEVRLGDRILWAGGDNISTFTSSVYKTKHAEIQDTKTNIDTATALYLGYVFPGYKSVVQKENEPYGWHFQKGELLGDVKYLEKQYLEPYAYIMMAVVENLGEVTYEFKQKGEPITLTYTTEMATKYAGKDIKLVGADIAELEKLIRKANLTDTHFWSETKAYVSDYEKQEYIELEILNKTGEEIWGINTIYYDGEDNKITELTGRYDSRGFGAEEWPIPVMVQDLFAYIDIERPDELYLKFEFNDIENVTYSTGDYITFPMEFGTKYQLELTGNAEEGYHVTLK